MLFCRRFARLVRVPQCYSSSKLLLKLVEVGPRDGLQNEISIIPTEIKVSLINQLTEAGLQFVEVSSFVNPKWVPQLADALQVFRQIKRCSLTRYSALVPNIQGFMDALEAKPDEVAVFTAASETFAKRNINCSIDESIKRFDEVLHLAKSQAIPVRGYVSCALGCPYEGSVSPDEVARVAELLWNIGCYEISLGDTVGRGTPESMNRLLTVMLTQGGACPREAVAVHCHDTGGNALANIGVALDHHGIRVVDSAIGGLGGCPYAGPDAPGNVATEAVVRLVYGSAQSSKNHHGLPIEKMRTEGKPQHLFFSLGYLHSSDFSTIFPLIMRLFRMTVFITSKPVIHLTLDNCSAPCHVNE